ncbi:MAG TPA: glycosyltransferase family A protein [Bryobacteraceae bacterium]|nr:glycosyltransferase family A protein [Bryobacteraceae bacterium]
MFVNPAISVVIPLYNKRQYIGRALRSLFSQTFADFEAIVVDDGSTDGGAAEVEVYQADPRLRIIRQRNAGGAAARNRGMRESRSSLIAFLDADDEFLPGHLEALHSLARQYPQAGLLVTGYYSVTNGVRRARIMQHEGPRLFEDYFAAGCRHGYLVTPSGCAVRRETLAAVGGFREGVRIGEDLEYWARIALEFPVAYDPRPSALYYMGVPGSAMYGFRWDPGTPAVADMLTGWLAGHRGDSRTRSIVDYSAWILLNHVASGIAASHRREARAVLRHPLIRQSRLRRRRAQLWLAAVSIPDWAMRPYLALREQIAHRRAGLPLGILAEPAGNLNDRA